MKLIDRIGVDISRRLKLEDAIEWAAKNHLRHIDIRVAPLNRQPIASPVRKPHSAAAELALGLMAQLSRKNGGDA